MTTDTTIGLILLAGLSLIMMVLPAIYGVIALIDKLLGKRQERVRLKARTNYYTELMYEDWRKHPEHAQGRKLPEEKVKK